ncbi:MAG: PKD domain-containing protein [Nanopusillaceae archaeon]
MLLLALVGCGPRLYSEPKPELRVYILTETTVRLELVNVTGTRYIWDLGDGSLPRETSTPSLTYTYTSPSLYVVTVTVETPGGGWPFGESTQQTLTATVDLRPAFELKGVRVVPLDPPPWYDPTTWGDCFPASINLELSPIYIMRAELTITDVHWVVHRENQYLLSGRGIVWVLPYDAFYCGCQGAVRYRIGCTVTTSDGRMYTVTREIWACPPNRR